MICRPLAFVASLLIATAVAPVALAHGPAPAVLGVAAYQGTELKALRLSDGLARKTATGWQYVCAERWHGPMAPRLAAAIQGDVHIAGADDLYRMDATGQVVAAGRPDLKAIGIHALVAAEDRVLALLLDAEGTRLVTADGPVELPLWASADSWPGAAGGDVGLYLAGARGDALAVVHLALDGKVLAAMQVAVPVDGLQDWTPTVHVSAGAPFFALRANQMHVIGRIVGGAWQTVAKDYPTVHGPALAGGALHVVCNGALRKVDGAGLSVIDASRWFTCLQEHAGVARACARTELWTLGADGLPADLGFTLPMLGPPTLAGLDLDAAWSCWAQWENFALDAGFEPGPEPAALHPEAEAPGMGGCSANRRARTSAPWSALLLLGVVFGSGRRPIGSGIDT